MHAFILNFTRILEKNPKVYASIIIGIALCLLLFVAEAVQIQNLVENLATKDQVLLTAAIEPVSDRYTWSRIFLLVLTLFWSVWEYRKSKHALGL